MAVDITGLPPVAIQGNGSNTSSHAAGESSGNTTAPANADVVTLTTQAAHIKALEADMSRQSFVDGNRVERLKAAIDAGSYVIDPTRVAEKFIEFEAGLSA